MASSKKPSKEVSRFLWVIVPFAVLLFVGILIAVVFFPLEEELPVQEEIISEEGEPLVEEGADVPAEESALEEGAEEETTSTQETISGSGGGGGGSASTTDEGAGESAADEDVSTADETGKVSSLAIPSSLENNCIGFLVGGPSNLETVSLIGAAWARPHPGPFSWGFIENTPGEYNFSGPDKWVKKAQENNVLLIATFFPYASWDQGGDSACQVNKDDQFYSKIPVYRCKPKDMDAYKNFLTILIERYDGDGVDDMPGLEIPVKYWEISNEPDILNSSTLTFFIGDEQDYVDLLKESYPTIKQACPDCMVLHGGAAGSQESFLSFWDNVFALGGGEYFDIANVHSISDPEVSDFNVQAFSSLLEKYNLEKPLWVTEVQFPSSDADVLTSTQKAFDAGAEKVIFTSFIVGVRVPPSLGQYSDVYRDVVALCAKEEVIVEGEVCTDVLPSCADGEDNDGDGNVDLNDSDCVNWEDKEQGINLEELGIVEIWAFEYDVKTDGAFVPDIVEYGGKLIMYVDEPSAGVGIISFSSTDGKIWTKDDGVRVASEKDVEYSHSFAAIAPDGTLYLFTQTQPFEQGKKKPYYLSISESVDGVQFTQPEAILRKDDFGGNHIAHGRILKLDDGTYLLAASAGYDPPDLTMGPGSILAYSTDLKEWNFSSIFFNGCHDPTFDTTENGIHLYCHFKEEAILRFDSIDGYSWDPQNPAGKVEFLDDDGIALGPDSYGWEDDIEAHTFDDGSKRMFISVHINGQKASVWSTLKMDEETVLCPNTLPTCADGEDNDDDGSIDIEDAECVNWRSRELTD